MGLVAGVVRLFLSFFLFPPRTDALDSDLGSPRNLEVTRCRWVNENELSREGGLVIDG